MITREKKAGIIKDLARNKNDNGSPQVQVGIMTARIAELTGHLKANKHDFAARRGLLQLVGKRRRHLKYISSKDSGEYAELIKKLGIRK